MVGRGVQPWSVTDPCRRSGLMIALGPEIPPRTPHKPYFDCLGGRVCGLVNGLYFEASLHLQTTYKNNMPAYWRRQDLKSTTSQCDKSEMLCSVEVARLGIPLQATTIWVGQRVSSPQTGFGVCLVAQPTIRGHGIDGFLPKQLAGQHVRVPGLVVILFGRSPSRHSIRLTLFLSHASLSKIKAPPGLLETGRHRDVSRAVTFSFVRYRQ